MQFQYLFILLLLSQGNGHEGTHGGEHGNGVHNPGGTNRFEVPNTYSATWSVNAQQSEITFTIVGSTIGCISLGWTKGNAAHAKNSDIVIGWVNNDGTVVAYQIIGTGNLDRPTTRSQQRITNISGSKTGDSTTISFTRPLGPADENDVDLRDPAILMVWAMGPVLGSGDSLNSYTFNQHTMYGNYRTNLLALNSATITSNDPTTVNPAKQENQNGNAESIDGQYIVWSLLGAAFLVVFGGAYFYQKNKDYQSQQHRASMKTGHTQNAVLDENATSACSSSNENDIDEHHLSIT